MMTLFHIILLMGVMQCQICFANPTPNGHLVNLNNSLLSGHKSGPSQDVVFLLLSLLEREQDRHNREMSSITDILHRHSREMSSITDILNKQSESLTILQNKVNSPCSGSSSSNVNDNNQGTATSFNPAALWEAISDLQNQIKEDKSFSPNADSNGDDCYPLNQWPTDCYDVARRGKNESGIYTIYPFRFNGKSRGVRVWCDMGDRQQGNEYEWTTLLQRRPVMKQVNFNRGWEDYRNGFGDPETEYWIGNAAIHELTSSRPQILRIDMTDWDGNKAYAQYHRFFILDENAQYQLHLSDYSGDAGDSLSGHNKQLFTTNDRDNDSHGTSNCATSYKGGFWYANCHAVNPTGLFMSPPTSTLGINWNDWRGREVLKEFSMKIRPKSCLGN